MVINIKYFLILPLSLFFALNTFAQTGIYPKSVDKKIQQSLNFENLGKPFVIQPQTTFQDNPLACLPASIDLLIIALFKGDSKSIDYAYNETNKMISSIEKVSKPSAEHLYLKSRLYLSKSILLSLKKDFFSSVWNFYKTFSMISETIQKFPDFAPSHTFGKIFNQVLKVIEEQDLTFSFLLPKPIKINETLNNINWSEYDKPIFFSLLAFVQNNPEDSEKIKFIPKTYTEAITIAMYQSSVYTPKEVLETISFIPDSVDITKSHIVGWSYMVMGQYDTAKEMFERSLKNNLTPLMKRSSLMGLYYIEIITKGGANRTDYLKRLSELPDSYNYRDLRAEKEINLEHHPSLLKARLFCDAKKYDEALNTLNTIKLNSLSDTFKLEYYYRYGRIYYLTKKFDLSMQYYLNCLNENLSSFSYYKAQAAYDIAHINYQKKDLSNADTFISRSIKLSKEANRKDIENKAKKLKKMIEGKN